MIQSHAEKEKECHDLLKQYMAKKGYKRYYNLNRELMRLMGHVEFHFVDFDNVKQEVLCFRSYNEMIATLKEKLKES